jgi:uncharacterized protein (UPF0264 family)
MRLRQTAHANTYPNPPLPSTVHWTIDVHLLARQKGLTVLKATEDKVGLLVSVRDPAEAIASVRGGAAIIDVKEPSRGSLGRADLSTMAAIVDAVAGRRIVSAAMGELVDFDGRIPQIGTGVQFAKFGLAKSGSRADWRNRLLDIRAAIETDASVQLVAVAYADWQRANAPPVLDVVDLAIGRRFAVLLIDTWRKDGTTLIDWLNLSTLVGLCEKAQRAGIRVALAGSLDLPQIRRLHSVRPNWFAVRGAACKDGNRDASIDERRVRRLVETLTDRMGTKEKEQPCKTP